MKETKLSAEGLSALEEKIASSSSISFDELDSFVEERTKQSNSFLDKIKKVGQYLRKIKCWLHHKRRG